MKGSFESFITFELDRYSINDGFYLFTGFVRDMHAALFVFHYL